MHISETYSVYFTTGRRLFTAFFLVALFSGVVFSSSFASDSFVLILKDGSTIVGVPENVADLDSPAGKTIKFKTSFGDVAIPGDQIVKFFSQEPQKAAEAVNQPAAEAAAKPSGDEPLVKPPAVKPPDTVEVKAEEIPTIEISDEKPVKDKKKAPSSADDLLEADDEKLMEMLESKKSGQTDAPAVEVKNEASDTSELQSIKNKYQAKKGIEPKELVPKNLASLTDDVKLLDAPATVEDMLLNSTAEVMVKLGDTKPVEVVKIGGGKEEGAGKKNGKKDKKSGKKEEKRSKKADGTSEASLSTSEVILDETSEVESLGGGGLSEKITKEFVKHKARPSKAVSGQEHLDSEIASHFPSPGEGKTAETEAAPAEPLKEKGGKKK